MPRSLSVDYDVRISIWVIRLCAITDWQFRIYIAWTFRTLSGRPVIAAHPSRSQSHLHRVDGEHDAVLGDARQRPREARHRQRGRRRQRLVVVGVAHSHSHSFLFCGGNFKQSSNSRVASSPRPALLIRPVGRIQRAAGVHVQTSCPCPHTSHSLTFM